MATTEQLVIERTGEMTTYYSEVDFPIEPSQEVSGDAGGSLPRCPHGVYDPYGDGVACTACQNQTPSVGPFCQHGTTYPFCRSCNKTCVTSEERALDEILRHGEKLDDAEIAEIAVIAETTEIIVRQVLEGLSSGQSR
jgi:hypothetical protein